MKRTPCKRKREKVHPFFKQFQKRPKKKRKVNKTKLNFKNSNWVLGDPIHVQPHDTFSVQEQEIPIPPFEENRILEDEEEEYPNTTSQYNTNNSMFRINDTVEQPSSNEETNQTPSMMRMDPCLEKYSSIKQYLLRHEQGSRSIIFFNGEIGTGKSFVMNKLTNDLNVHEINDVNIGPLKIRQVFESTQSHGVQNQSTILLFENVDLFKYGYYQTQLKRLLDDTLKLSKIPIVFIQQSDIAKRNRNYLKDQVNLEVSFTFYFRNLDLYPRLPSQLPRENLQQIILKQDLVLEYFHQHCIMKHVVNKNNEQELGELKEETFGEFFVNMYKKELIPLGCICCNDVRWMINQLFLFGLIGSNTNENMHIKDRVINMVRRRLGSVCLKILCIDRLIHNILTPWTFFGIREVCESDTNIARTKLNFFFLNYNQKKSKEFRRSQTSPNNNNNNNQKKEEDDDDEFRRKCEFIDIYSELDCDYTKINPLYNAVYGYDEEELDLERRMTGCKTMLEQEKNYVLYGTFKYFCSTPSGFSTTQDMFSDRNFWRCEESVGLSNGVRVKNPVFEKLKCSFRERVFGMMMKLLPVEHRLKLKKSPEYVDFVDRVCMFENMRRERNLRKRRFFHFFQQVLSDGDYTVLSFWRDGIRKFRNNINFQQSMEDEDGGGDENVT